VDGTFPSSVFDADGVRVAVSELANGGAIAQHITRCVNAYDDLIGAMREAEGECRRQIVRLELEGFAKDSISVRHWTHLRDRFKAVLEKASA
jgi:hypothetical protein